jgi:DNA-binding GntR family transcriptional regulator
VTLPWGDPTSDTVSATVSSGRTAVRLGSWVYDQLKARLLEGRYHAGERLHVEDIRKEFGVSKQPVMEALRRLSSDGLVTIIPQVGCQVTGYGLQEVEDFFRMFGSFEAAIAEAAAQRRSDRQLAELEAISAQIGRLCDEQDPQVRSHGYRVLNRQFHAAVHAMAQSRVMAETSHRMWDLSDFLINTTGVAQPLHTALASRHSEHESIRAALAAGDAKRARAEMERHIVDTLEIIKAESATQEAQSS